MEINLNGAHRVEILHSKVFPSVTLYFVLYYSTLNLSFFFVYLVRVSAMWKLSLGLLD